MSKNNLYVANYRSHGKCETASHGQWRLRSASHNEGAAFGGNHAVLSVSWIQISETKIVPITQKSIFDSPAVFTRNLKGLKSFVDLWCNHELETKFTVCYIEIW